MVHRPFPTLSSPGFALKTVSNEDSDVTVTVTLHFSDFFRMQPRVLFGLATTHLLLSSGADENFDDLDMARPGSEVEGVHSLIVVIILNRIPFIPTLIHHGLLVSSSADKNLDDVGVALVGSEVKGVVSTRTMKSLYVSSSTNQKHNDLGVAPLGSEVEGVVPVRRSGLCVSSSVDENLDHI